MRTRTYPLAVVINEPRWEFDAEGTPVLEYGFGTGWTLAYRDEWGEGGIERREIVGFLDEQAEAVEQAQRHLNEIGYEWPHGPVPIRWLDDEEDEDDRAALAEAAERVAGILERGGFRTLGEAVDAGAFGPQDEDEP